MRFQEAAVPIGLAIVVVLAVVLTLTSRSMLKLVRAVAPDAVVCTDGTPAPSHYSITITDPRNQPDLIRQYGNALLGDGAPPNGRFNPSPDPDHDLAVMLPGPPSQPVNQRTFRYGPKGEVQAERCSHQNAKAALVEGRVVMRVQIRRAGRAWPIPQPPGDSGYHKRVNGQVVRYFEPGWSYVWIDSYSDSIDAGGALVGATARAIIVSANPGITHVNVRKVFIELHTNPHSSSYGLWRTTPHDDHAWSTCWGYGCCEVQADE